MGALDLSWQQLKKQPTLTGLEVLVSESTQDEMTQATPNTATIVDPGIVPAAIAAGGQPVKAAADRKRGRLSDDKRFKIFSGSANKPLCEEVCAFVGVPMGQTKMQKFSDGEIHFQRLENVRGADVFVVQPTCFPVDQNLVELLIMMDALRRASAG